jgi:signal peptidase II
MKKIILLVSIVVADQLLKYLALKGELPPLGGLVHLTCNPAIAWSIPLHGILFWILWLLAISALGYLLYTNRYNTFLLLAFAGAIANLIDRAILGCVVDYISILRFPVFNLADIAITVGITGFVIFQLTFKTHKTKGPRA